MIKSSFKLFIFLFIIVTLISCKPVLDESITSKYILSKSELENYCIEKYSSNSTFKQTKKQSVEDVFEGVPIEQYSKSEALMKAKEDLEIDHYGGCGPISLISQLDFLARYANYPSISKYDTLDGQIDLARRVFFKTPTFRLDSGDVFTLPNSLVDTAYKILEDFNLEKQFKITQYSVLNTRSQKIDKIKESINKGMPVILWTLGSNTGYFHDHYMNIYSYEEWSGLDSTGDIITNTFFELRVNRNRADSVFMDSDILTGTWGIIIFEEVYENISIEPSSYGYFDSYNFIEDTNEIVAKYKNSTFYPITKSLRTGFILDKYLTMSAKIEEAGNAYIEYKFDIPIYGLNVDISLWSGFEEISVANATINLEYKDQGERWIKVIDFMRTNLSTNKDYPSNYNIYFDIPVNEFRFYVTINKTNNMGNVDRGRVVIGNLNLYTGTHQHQFNYIEGVTQHELYCTLCKFSKFEKHKYIDGKCIECGNIDANHIHDNLDVVDEVHQKVCRICNQPLNCHNLIFKNNYYLCLDCGFTLYIDNKEKYIIIE